MPRSDADASELRMPPAELRARLDFDDEHLLAECQTDHYRVSGPGGQHRNKVSTAIRLHHRPSGLVVTGTESRSQAENKVWALKRLREAIALTARIPLPAELRWPPTVHVADGRIRVNDSNPGIHHTIALLLDAFMVSGGALREAAECLGLTPSSVVRFLGEHPKAWRAVADIRQRHSLPPLKPK